MITITITSPTLFQVASQYLGDPTQWTDIAVASGITDPWLDGVTTLVIPTTSSSAGTGNGAI